MKTVFKILIAAVIVCVLVACQQKESTKVKIAIILPMEHQSLQEIAAGFSDKLHKIYQQPIQIKIMNAQGDANLQRAIIQQVRDQNYTLVVPIATGVTQMAASMIHNKPLISLAADFSEQDRQKLRSCNIGVVHDAIPPQKLIELIRVAYPHLIHLTLIHSTSDKIYSDVKAAIAAGKKAGIEIKPLMVATLPELTSISQALPTQTQGILVLKDNLIVSGIATLAKTASERRIPLFTADQGSVESGAGFGLGVYERQIGEEGAQLAKAALEGKSLCEIPIIDIPKLSVFINKHALQQEQQNPALIEAAAKNLNYPVEFVSR